MQMPRSPARLTDAQDSAIAVIAETTGRTKSDVLRAALDLGLAAMRDELPWKARIALERTELEAALADKTD